MTPSIDELAEAMIQLPEAELKRMMLLLDELIIERRQESQKIDQARVHVRAGGLDTGECAHPDLDRDTIYEERPRDIFPPEHKE